LPGAGATFSVDGPRQFSSVRELLFSVRWKCPRMGQVSMMKAPLRAGVLAALFFASSWYGWEFANSSAAAKEPQTTTSSKPNVYVSDFEIDVAPSQSTNRAGATKAGAETRDDDPRILASRLVELMSTKLVVALRKAGYSAARMRPGAERPESGVRIRGLYTEIDNENHWRRAVIRTAEDSGKMQAVVSVGNLAKPDQAMYEIANFPGNEDKPGAVITLSAYVPLTKFDLRKDANEDVFKGIAARIVNDLTAFLDANPSAMSQ
jgi:hypothetical protein